jgi:hypothetical protein
MIKTSIGYFMDELFFITAAGSGLRVLEHKFPSVGKRYAPSWSVLSLLGFKFGCPVRAGIKCCIIFLFTLRSVIFLYSGESYFEGKDVLRVKTVDAKARTVDFS